MDPSIPLHKQSFRPKAIFVLKHGVLGWGLLTAGAIILFNRYRHGSWGTTSDNLLMIAIWCVMGIPQGLMQMRTMKFHDPAKRCAECGEADPNHTKWCRRQSIG